MVILTNFMLLRTCTAKRLQLQPGWIGKEFCFIFKLNVEANDVVCYCEGSFSVYRGPLAIGSNMVSEDVLNRIRTVMMTVRQPGNYDKVYKDECMFTFDTPASPSGLYINLNTHQAFGEEYLKQDFDKTGNALYLHEKWNKVT